MNKNPHQAQETLRKKFKEDPEFRARQRENQIKGGRKSALTRKLLKEENEELKKELQEAKENK